jgi:hypothetical protein
MTPARHLRICLAWLCCTAAATPVWADSFTSMSASSTSSASIGSVSGSIQGSSRASSNTNQTAAGDYRVLDVAQTAERPDALRLRLQAVAGAADDSFYLFVPRATAEREQLATGGVLTARTRPYGVEFARADAAQAFFLVLEDRWYQELDSHPVAL